MIVSRKMADRKPYSSAGRCIYCLNPFDELTREHFVPESLEGSWFIRGACNECAKRSNEDYENDVLKSDMVRTVRSMLDLKRKRKNKKPPIVMPALFAYGTADKLEIEDTDYVREQCAYPREFAIIALEPAMLLSPENGHSLEKRPIRIWLRNIEDLKPRDGVLSDPTVVENAYTSKTDLILTADVDVGGQSVSIRQRFPLLKFMRMLAKIAYCFAVAERGLDGFKDSEIRKLVRGERDDCYNFVGGALHGDRLTSSYMHHLAFRERGKWQTVIVHLFSSFHAPAYEVIIGEV